MGWGIFPQVETDLKQVRMNFFSIYVHVWLGHRHSIMGKRGSLGENSVNIFSAGNIFCFDHDHGINKKIYPAPIPKRNYGIRCQGYFLIWSVAGKSEYSSRYYQKGLPHRLGEVTESQKVLLKRLGEVTVSKRDYPIVGKTISWQNKTKRSVNRTKKKMVILAREHFPS